MKSLRISFVVGLLVGRNFQLPLPSWLLRYTQDGAHAGTSEPDRFASAGSIPAAIERHGGLRVGLVLE
jgi:hypothetical protein